MKRSGLGNPYFLRRPEHTSNSTYKDDLLPKSVQSWQKHRSWTRDFSQRHFSALRPHSKQDFAMAAQFQHNKRAGWKPTNTGCTGGLPNSHKMTVEERMRPIMATCGKTRLWSHTMIERKFQSYLIVITRKCTKIFFFVLVFHKPKSRYRLNFISNTKCWLFPRQKSC